jgi:hypothetical protein
VYSTSLLLFLFAAAAGAHGLYNFQVKHCRVGTTSPKLAMSVCITPLSSSSFLRWLLAHMDCTVFR